METESITVLIESSAASPTDPQYMKDRRTITLQATRADVAKALDEFCAKLEADFES